MPPIILDCYFIVYCSLIYLQRYERLHVVHIMLRMHIYELLLYCRLFSLCDNMGLFFLLFKSFIRQLSKITITVNYNTYRSVILNIAYYLNTNKHECLLEFNCYVLKSIGANSYGTF